MKKLAILMIGATLMFTACKKDKDDPTTKLNPTQDMFGLAINYTATWCSPCGNWGAPLIHDLKNVNANRVVAMTVHASGDPMYISNLYSEFDNDRSDNGGIPAFWVGDIYGSGGAVAKMEALLGNVPNAGIDYAVTKTSTSFTIKTMVKFFSAVSGEYYLSTFILEDGIDGSTSAGAYKQNGTANPDTYEHDFVLRASASGTSYGELIASGSIAKDQIFENTYTINNDPAWVNDVSVVCILWKKEGSDPGYKFVNAFFDKTKITAPTQ